MEADEFKTGQLIFSDGNSLKTTDGVSTWTIAGHARRWGSSDGVGSAARFVSITSFCQINATDVAVVDSNKAYLRRVDRSTNHTSQYGQAVLVNPRSVFKDRITPSRMVVGIRAINPVQAFDGDQGPANHMSILSKSAQLEPLTSIAQDEHGNFLITTDNEIYILFYYSQYVQLLAGSGRFGHRDGPLQQSSFSTPSAILQLNDYEYLIADSSNHRLRILDMPNQLTSSLCVGRTNLCSVHNPQSLLIVNRTLYIGDKGTISFIKGNPMLTTLYFIWYMDACVVRNNIIIR